MFRYPKENKVPEIAHSSYYSQGDQKGWEVVWSDSLLSSQIRDNNPNQS